MKNLVQGGDCTIVQYTNATGSAITSGQPVLLGDQGLHGVAVEDIANAATGSVVLSGCYAVASLSVHGHNGSANAAVDAYDKVYLTAGESFVDVDSAATFFGYTLASQTSGGTTSKNVLLAPAIS